jgi:hypothetical protein
MEGRRTEGRDKPYFHGYSSFHDWSTVSFYNMVRLSILLFLALDLLLPA